MKSLSLIFFTLSISCILIGYMELKIINKTNMENIEYRIAPKELIETQFNQPSLKSSFDYLFNEESIIPDIN